MSAQPTTPVPTDPAAPSPATGAPEAPTPTEPAAAAPVAPTEPAKSGEGLPDDPAALKAEIARLRQENGKDRTNAKQAAADEARNELAQTIGKALGLVKDDETADPAKIAEQATASAKSARVELAIFKAAAAAGGDPLALLDSATFLKTAASIDPSDPAAVTAAIQEAVAANPRLGAAPESRLPAPNPAQGTSGGGTVTGPTQLSKAEVERLYAAKAYGEIDKARAEGRLSDYLSAPNAKP